MSLMLIFTFELFIEILSPIGGFKKDVSKSVQVGNSSIVIPLVILRQNDLILSVVLIQLGLGESFLITRIRS
jgi:hypothetical protein